MKYIKLFENFIENSLKEKLKLINIVKPTHKTIIKAFGENFREIFYNDEEAGAIIISNLDDQDNVVQSIFINEDLRNKGIAKAVYIKYVLENGEILSGQFYNEGEISKQFSIDAKNLWDSLKKEYNVEIINNYNYKRYKLSLSNNPKLISLKDSLKDSINI